MFDILRNALNSLIFRILVGIILFSLCAWGLQDIFFSNYNSKDIVQFKNIPNITEAQFFREQYRLSKILYGLPINSLSDEQRQRLETQALNSLVTFRLLSGLANKFDVNFDSKFLVDKFIASMFENEERFSSFLEEIHVSRKEYLDKLNEVKSFELVLKLFNEMIQPPSVLSNYFIQYLQRSFVFDLIKIDLKKTPNVTSTPNIEVLEEFYNNHKEQFTLPKEYQVKYSLVKVADMVKYEPQEKEILDYIENHGLELDSKSSAAKKKARSMLIDEKKYIDFSNLKSKIEDQVAQGLSLEDIAKAEQLLTRSANIIIVKNNEFSLDLRVKDDTDLTAMLIEDNKIREAFKNELENLNLQETGYPIDTVEGFLFFKVLHVSPPYLPKLEEIKAQVIAAYQENETRKINIQRMYEFETEANSIINDKKLPIETQSQGSINTNNQRLFVEKNNNLKHVNSISLEISKLAAKKGLNYEKDLVFSTHENSNIKILPEEIIESISKFLKPVSLTQIVENKDFAYIALLKSTKQESFSKEENAVLKDKIIEFMKNSYINELLEDMKTSSNLKVNYK